MRTINSLCIIILFLFLLYGQTGLCVELDTSIDKEISKKYNTYSLEDGLPSLPEDIEVENIKSSGDNFKSQNIINDNFTAIKIKRGTKFKVVSKTPFFFSTTTTLSISKFPCIEPGNVFFAGDSKSIGIIISNIIIK